jgi:pseudouridine synthase
LLAHSGIASRRHSAAIIRDGRVTVDGVCVREPGFRVDAEASLVLVDGKQVAAGAPERHRYVMLNKPRGLICSSDDSQGPNVFECLRGIRQRLVHVGRLDKDSEGLLLLSTDGDFVNRLTHPSYGYKKEYVVTVRGTLDGGRLAALRASITLSDGTELHPIEVDLIDSEPHLDIPRHRLLMTLVEGRNRQVRRMCDHVGLHVQRLIRISIGGVTLPRELAVGAWRDLTSEELRALGATND